MVTSSVSAVSVPPANVVDIDELIVECGVGLVDGVVTLFAWGPGDFVVEGVLETGR
jgi:hypothetical protein